MREMIFLIPHEGMSNMIWMITVVLKTIIRTFMPEVNVEAKRVYNHGPAPSRIIIPKRIINTNMRGNHALRSEEEGIMVLLMVNIK